MQCTMQVEMFLSQRSRMPWKRSQKRAQKTGMYTYVIEAANIALHAAKRGNVKISSENIVAKALQIPKEHAGRRTGNPCRYQKRNGMLPSGTLPLIERLAIFCSSGKDAFSVI